MILKGNDLIIKSNGVALAASKSCTIKVKAKTIDVSSPTDGQWEHSILGRMSWQVSTNHLVMSIARSMQMAGTTVSLEISIRGGVRGPGRYFQGFVDNVTLQSDTYSGTLSIVYWDKTRKKFVGYLNPAAGVYIYYEHWTDDSAYTSPSAYDVFRYNGVAYTWLSNELVAEKLTGQAHITSWNSSGARGNLITGSFEFHGNGALTPATIP